MTGLRGPYLRAECGGSYLRVCGLDVLSDPGDCFPAGGREQHPSP